mgnify:CR=1 FL=1
MNKYVRYAMWLAQVLVCIVAVIYFAKYAQTGDVTYSAGMAICLNALVAMLAKERLDDLSARIEIIESKQRRFMSFETAIAAEQLDCKERVDNLIKTLNGDE